jgi:hypothetical protein
MKSNAEKENVNQHRRQSLEGMDEIRHRQNRLGTEAQRRNGKCASRIHGKTQVDRTTSTPIGANLLGNIQDDDFLDKLIMYRQLRLDVVRNIVLNRVELHLSSIQRNLATQGLTQIIALSALVVTFLNFVFGSWLPNISSKLAVSIFLWGSFVTIFVVRHFQLKQRYHDVDIRRRRRVYEDRKVQYGVLRKMVEEDLIPLLEKKYAAGKIDETYYEKYSKLLVEMKQEWVDRITKIENRLKQL